LNEKDVHCQLLVGREVYVYTLCKLLEGRFSSFVKLSTPILTSPKVAENYSKVEALGERF
jgi:hypothetical protein